ELSSAPRCLFLAAGVAAERTGRGELAELVADHRLRDVDRDVLAAVVHRDRVPDHLGDDRRAATPGPDHSLLVLLVESLDLLGQMLVDGRALLQTGRLLSSPPTLLRPATHPVPVRRVVLLASARLGLAPQADRVTAT